MWRLAASCVGLTCIATVACGSSKATHAIENQSGRQDLTASYLCAIEEAGYKYPQFPCAIREVDGQFVLAKLAGTQRFRGIVRPLGEGFSFDGEFFCPWADCAQPMHGVFEPAGNGALKGTFRDVALVVTLVPSRGYGGNGYGGEGYGGGGYGGAGYGGRGYGGRRR